MLLLMTSTVSILLCVIVLTLVIEHWVVTTLANLPVAPLIGTRLCIMCKERSLVFYKLPLKDVPWRSWRHPLMGVFLCSHLEVLTHFLASSLHIFLVTAMVPGPTLLLNICILNTWGGRLTPPVHVFLLLLLLLLLLGRCATNGAFINKVMVLVISCGHGVDLAGNTRVIMQMLLLDWSVTYRADFSALSSSMLQWHTLFITSAILFTRQRPWCRSLPQFLVLRITLILMRTAPGW